jgi:hypothetical protein
MNTEGTWADLVNLPVPPTPDLAAGVRKRIERHRRRRRLVVSATAALVALAALAIAVPASRSAFGNWLHLGGESIERSGTLPAAVDRPLTVALGPPVSVREAAKRLGIPPLWPPAGRFVVVRSYASGGIAVFVIRWQGTPILLSELAYSDVDLVKKFVGPGTRLERVSVNGSHGYWISGEPHVLAFQRMPSGRIASVALRIGGHVLAWQQGNLTLRIEGGLTKAAALQLARVLGR